jgi:hypothetical protein
MAPALVAHSIGGEPDAELHTAVGCDVKTPDGGGQVQLSLHLQIGFRCGLEGAGGDAPPSSETR